MTLRLPLTHLSVGERTLDEAASRYLLRVHRLRVGARLVAFDPEARREADLELLESGGKRARVAVTNVRDATRVATRAVTVLQGLAKGTKVDAVVRDATELGATRLVVVRCERSVKRSVDVERCRRVALEAARQSGRGDVPVVEGPMPFVEAVRDAAPGLRLVLHADGDRSLAAFPLASDAEVTLAIGPEGGFTADEMDAARDAGFALARLGRFVLRTETACAAALGALAAVGDDA